MDLPSVLEPDPLAQPTRARPFVRVYLERLEEPDW
jgi:hypothetical protein